MSGKHKMYKNKIHLTDLNSCRRYLSRVINQLDDGVIDGKEARDRGYIIKIIADILQEQDIEREVQKISEQLAKVNNGKWSA